MNFTIDEFLKSDVAKKNKIDNVILSDKIYENIMRLVCDLLQPLRDYVKQPVIVSSGYRCPSLNFFVGGSPNSQHLLGEAVDIKISGYTPSKILDVINKIGLVFDQAIIEKGWLHISLKSKNNRKVVLKNV